MTDTKEPSTMSPDKKRLLAKKEAPQEVEQVSEQAIELAQDAPITKEIFEAQVQRLIERARAAGLNPVRTLARTYAKRGLAILDGLLSALENERSPADNPKKKE